MPLVYAPEHLVFHFLDVTGSTGTPRGWKNTAVKKVVDRAIFSGNDLRMGVALHTFADTYSHHGFTWKAAAEVNFYESKNPKLRRLHVGHAMTMVAVDDPSEFPQQATEAAMEIFGILKTFGTFQGILEKNMKFSEPELAGWLEFVFRSIKGNMGHREEQWKALISSTFGEIVEYEGVIPTRTGVFGKAVEEQLDIIKEQMEVPLLQ